MGLAEWEGFKILYPVHSLTGAILRLTFDNSDM